MTDREILKEAVEKVQKNNYNLNVSNNNMYWLQSWLNETNLLDFPYQIIIFSHDFAKAFWGKNRIQHEDLTFSTTYDVSSYVQANFERWEYHLQQMVLEEEPLKYLEKFL